MYPFSFSEFVEFTTPELKNKLPTTATTRGLFSQAFTRYLKLGGMPLHVINTETRETTAMLAAMVETKLSSGLILTKNTSKTIKASDKTIQVMPVYQWLLSAKR